MKFLACVLALAVVASATALPAGWEMIGRVPAEAHVPVLIAVKHRGDATAVLTNSCNMVSDPASPKYGHYLTQEEVQGLVMSEDNMQTVMSWLASFGVTVSNEESTLRVGATGDFLRFTAPAGLVEAMFGGVRMNLYRVAGKRSVKGKYVARTTDEIAIPDFVEAAIDSIIGITDVRALTDTRRVASTRAPVTEAAASTTGPSPPMGSVVIISTDTLYLYPIVNPAQIADSYEVELTVNQATTHTITFDSDKLERMSVGTELPGTLLAMNTTTGIVPYGRYNVSITAVSKDGSRSTPWTLPFNWASVPKDFTGILGTPTFSPAEYRAFYGISDTLQGNGVQGVIEFGSQYYTPSDLASFWKMFGITEPKPVRVSGATNDPTNPGIEASMDIQLISGVSPQVENVFYLTEADSTYPQGWILEWAAAMSDDSNPPLVSSISYGTPENTETEMYYSRTEAEFLKMCNRGLTVTISSGDAGATSDGHGGAGCTIEPSYPASSSWVTAVSATMPSADAPARPGQKVGEAAISVSTGAFWTTGGGFSNIESNRVPKYQASAVAKYLATAKMPPTGQYNATGRGYPDISSVGTNYWMTIMGNTLPLGSGTSAASPTFAGVVARLNDARLAAGMPPLGFLNPLLYSLAESHPEVFYDVTVGGNACGEFLCCPYGFEATKGWDAVTGLGTVGDYDLLKSLVLAAARA